MFGFSCSACCSSEAQRQNEISVDSKFEAKAVFMEEAAAEFASAGAEPFAGQLKGEKMEGFTPAEDDPLPGPQENRGTPEAILAEEISKEEIIVKVSCNGVAKLGITMDMCDDDLCFVSTLRDEGLVPTWNSSCEEKLVVQEFFRLVSVNGLSSKTKELVKSILTVMASGGPLEMAFTRPIKFVAVIDRKNGSWSLGVESYVAKSQYLALTELQPIGALQEWNQTSPDHKKISTYSRIIAVNGVTSNGEEIMETMKKLDQFSIAVINWP